MSADDLMTGPASSGPCANRHAGRLWAGLIPPAVWPWSLCAVPELTCGLLPALLERFCETGETASFAGLVDAMPVILARRGRRCNAKVAPELASSGYLPDPASV